MRALRKTRQRGPRLTLLCLVLCAAALALPMAATARWHSAQAQGQPDLSQKRVLVLHSYHQGFTWTDDISKGIQSAFAPYADQVELIYEFMDTRRIYDRVHTALQLALDSAGIDMPFPTKTVNLRVEQDTSGLAPGLSGSGQPAR